MLKKVVKNKKNLTIKHPILTKQRRAALKKRKQLLKRFRFLALDNKNYKTRQSKKWKLKKVIIKNGKSKIKYYKKLKYKQIAQQKQKEYKEKSRPFTFINNEYKIPLLYQLVANATNASPVVLYTQKYFKSLNKNKRISLNFHEYISCLKRNLWYYFFQKGRKNFYFLITTVLKKIKKYKRFVRVIKIYAKITFSVSFIVKILTKKLPTIKMSTKTNKVIKDTLPYIAYSVHSTKDLLVSMRRYSNILKESFLYDNYSFFRWMIIKIELLSLWFKGYLDKAMITFSRFFFNLVKFTSSNKINFEMFKKTKASPQPAQNTSVKPKRKYTMKLKEQRTVYRRYLDHVHGSYWFGKFINMFIRSGKKRKAIINVNIAFDSLKYSFNLLMYKVLIVALHKIRPVFVMRTYKTRNGRIINYYPVLAKFPLLYMKVLIWIKYGVSKSYESSRRTGIRSFMLIMRNSMIQYMTNLRNHPLVNRRRNYVYSAVTCMMNRRFNRRGRNIIKGF